MKQTKKQVLLTSIARSKKLQCKLGAMSELESENSNKTPLPTSDDVSLASSLHFEKNIIPKRELAADSEPKFTGEN